MFKATKFLSAALAIAVLAPIPAMAETVSLSVRYSDLDLSNPSGQKVFARRIAAASRHICGAADMERDITRKARVKQCQAEVRRSAEPDRLAAIATKTRAVS